MKAKNQAWMFADYELADATAVQAVAKGIASPEQQKRAIKWIVEAACATYDMSYRPGGEDGRRDTDFAEGRRMVGNQIVKMINTDLAKMRRKEPNADPHKPTS